MFAKLVTVIVVLGAMYGFDWSQTPETPTTQPSTQPAPTAP